MEVELKEDAEDGVGQAVHQRMRAGTGDGVVHQQRDCLAGKLAVRCNPESLKPRALTRLETLNPRLQNQT